MNFTETLFSTLSTGMVVVHIWMLFFHKHRLGSKTSDRSFDPLYSKFLEKFTFGFIILAQIYVAAFFEPRNENHSFLNFILGTLLFYAGASLRLWSMKVMGELFTFEVGLRDSHRVVTDGPYQWIRHPSYTGYFFLLAGIALTYHSMGFAILFLPGSLIFFIYRVYVEEKLLMAHFGEQYTEYKKKTWKLFPPIF